MKKLLIAVVILLSCFSCKHKKAAIGITDSRSDTTKIYDTVYVARKVISIDTLSVCSKPLDSLDGLNNTIRSRDSALFEARFKLARVWYYDSLCLKNSRLDKYLKGWVRRALEK